jgi:hypothetical protein
MLGHCTCNRLWKGSLHTFLQTEPIDFLLISEDNALYLGLSTFVLMIRVHHQPFGYDRCASVLAQVAYQ